MPNTTRAVFTLLATLCLVATTHAQQSPHLSSIMFLVPEPARLDVPEESSPFVEEPGPVIAASAEESSPVVEEPSPVIAVSAEESSPVVEEPGLVIAASAGEAHEAQVVHFQAPPTPTCCRKKHGAWSRFKRWLRESHWGYPGEFVERPLGSSIAAHARVQIINGLAERMVLYRCDFHDEAGRSAAQLTPYGKTRLKKMAEMLYHPDRPVAVEPTPGRPKLDQARRQSVLRALAELGLDASPEMVIVRPPESAGLAGEEAVQIHENMLQHGASGGGAGGAAEPTSSGILAMPIGP